MLWVVSGGKVLIASELANANAEGEVGEEDEGDEGRSTVPSPPTTRPCPWCGTLVVRRRGRSRYCTQVCRVSAWRAYTETLEMITNESGRSRIVSRCPTCKSTLQGQSLICQACGWQPERVAQAPSLTVPVVATAAQAREPAGGAGTPKAGGVGVRPAVAGRSRSAPTGATERRSVRAATRTEVIASLERDVVRLHREAAALNELISAMNTVLEYYISRGISDET